MTGRALFIGRFQPFHRGHLTMVRRILESNDEMIVGIGSAQYSHTGENPFTAGERYEMIKRSLDAEGILNYHIVPIPDTHVHSVWVSHVRSLVPHFDDVYTNSDLVVRLFREHGVKVHSPPLVDRERLSGTEVRQRMLKGGDWESLVPAVVAEHIREIDGIERIRETHKYSTPYGTRENHTQGDD
ncbi:MAG TPA: nicotinamide-nucleotide adenylyltransferase [Thermoplasmata archaeon]|uniref:Nicotinamide-nucleotide adenylyltransferase n=1 Tax=uncultured euryarchaeote Rifle_16ft_4_minimus_37884 TaxID=1665196 RepID=A0A0H4T613_9EURY|nr:nicotinamide-nucleotide adenylyltransferase, nicotinamide-nucleotide adenylyltransferase [uncultured euryarchaeote Rifle_16ft_4_minimus_37884]